MELAAIIAKSKTLVAASSASRENLRLTSRKISAQFTLSERHRDMLLHGLDRLGASLRYEEQIKAFAARWHARHPWLKDLGKCRAVAY